MAKFNIEVELDWLDEEQKLDDVLKEEILASLKTHVTQKATENINKELSSFMEEQRSSIEQMFTEKIDTFLGNTFADQIGKMQIPYKGNSWQSEVEYIPMSEFVGKRYEAFLNKKVLDADGNSPRYASDAKMSINEFFINKYLEKGLAKKISTLIQTARHDAEETVVATLEENLRSQLSADIIKRLNIPAMLGALQEKAALLEKEN